jgi:hypothetical protein
MRASNVTTAVAVLLWFGVLLMGHGLVEGVARRMGGSVNMGQIDYYVIWPAAVVAGLLACAWACNALRRWYGLLTLTAALALCALAPFLMFYTGGV